MRAGQRTKSARVRPGVLKPRTLWPPWGTPNPRPPNPGQSCSGRLLEGRTCQIALLLVDPAAGYFKPSLCVGYPGYIPWPWDTHIGRTCAPAALEHRQCWEGTACQRLADLVALFSHRQLAASPWLMHLLARGPGGTGSHCTARLYVPSDKKRGHLKVGVGGPCRARWDLGTLRWGGGGTLDLGAP